ncbi:MAG: alpha/beta fold hydrolase [Actinomycetota bacterium]
MSSEQLPVSTPAAGVFESFDGTAIAFRVRGEATGLAPLFCCSGIACDEMYWTLLGPALASERQVVTWDYPYHGDSGPAASPREITVASLARHAHALGRHLGLPPAAFAGHSMGVQVALEYYRLFPEEVSGLALIAGPYRHTVAHLYGTPFGTLILTLVEAGARMRPEAAQALWRLAVTPEVADPVGRLGGLIGPAPPQMMRRYFRHLASLPLVPLVEMFKEGQLHSADAFLDDISVPVLILHGTRDVMTPIALAREMAARIPTAELVAVEGGAHTLPIEDPELVNREVRRFLHRRVDRRA